MNKIGFSLIEIILATAVSMIVFVFVFYFLTTISLQKKYPESPILLNEFNYSNNYCQLKNDYKNISTYKDVDLGKYISTSTPITSINIFRKNTLIVTTNSASTTEPDIFLFDLSNMNLIKSLNTGPGLTDAILNDNYLYAINNSVNSHIQTFTITTGDVYKISDFRIDELSINYSLPKSIYLINTDTPKLIIGSEKNNLGSELFIIDLNDHIPYLISNTVEIDGQVNDIYFANDYLYIANANDNELLVYDKDLNYINLYNAPMTLGNGKSVYYINPFVLLGRTVASFELNILSTDNNLLTLISKYSTQGTIDYIEPLIDNYLFMTNYSPGELLFMDKNFKILGRVNVPARVNAYTCMNDSLIIANIINNKSHIIWLK